MIIDEIFGEVVEVGIELVLFDFVGLDEDVLIVLFLILVQCVGVLLKVCVMIVYVFVVFVVCLKVVKDVKWNFIVVCGYV